jgi:hypothetical protein
MSANGATPRMGIEDTMAAILDSVQQMVTVLEMQLSDRGSDRVSSISFEDMAKGPPKVVSKMYAGSPISRHEIDEALDAHAYAHREAERRQMEGWAETVAKAQDEANQHPHAFRPAASDYTLCEVCGSTLGKSWHTLPVPDAKQLEELPDFSGAQTR